MIYECLDCGKQFDEPKAYSEDLTPGEVFEGGSFSNYFTGCPFCAGAYEETVECCECGSRVLMKNGELIGKKFYCDSCIKDYDL